MADEKNERPSYKDLEQAAQAVEIFKGLRQYLIENHPEATMPVVHMASCLMEEACNRTLPNDMSGTLLITTARLLAPDIIDEIYQDEMADAGVFNIPGSDEIH